MQRRHAHTLFLSLLTCMAGCGDGFLKFKWDLTEDKPDVEEGFVDATVEGISDSKAYQDSIAAQGYIEGLRRMRVRGYGLVAGLGTTGSSECPKNIRDRLVQEMYKRPEFSRRGLKPAVVSPEEVLRSLDTAVVVIEGEIPAAAQKGTTFDLTVRALAGTQTTSLAGGSLYTSELFVYRENAAGGAVEGRALATAAGPIFVNPFANKEDESERQTTTMERQGVILGGGTSISTRRIRFVLSTPSYRRARLITDTANARFPGRGGVAKAESPSNITIRIPAAYQDDPFHFLALFRHLYLPTRPGFLETRTQELAKEILEPNAPHADIAIAWEGIGRTVLPTIQELYTDQRPYVRFYSALTGMRLGDGVAVDVVGEFALNPESPYRLTAIDELGNASNSYRTSVVLRRLLSDKDPRIRVEAYEALLPRRDEMIQTSKIGHSNFMLDLVDSPGPNLVYVRRTGDQRIALLGERMYCMPPVFYQDPNNLITINAEEDDRKLTLIRRSKFGDRISPPLPTDFELGSLIDMLGNDPKGTSEDHIHGLALDYATITRTLHDLCESGGINAKFMLQRNSTTEMFGPMTSTGRSESDL
ncbi:MAG TPA: flagellar basal body P-ring protein FlgI [Phycisphaerae bacterium]|nr:flagellar basal body P-ring protein FlgI [Phycisphaerae bacterium]